MINIHLIQNQTPFVVSSIKGPLSGKEIHDVQRSTRRAFKSTAQTAKNRRRNRHR